MIVQLVFRVSLQLIKRNGAFSSVCTKMFYFSLNWLEIKLLPVELPLLPPPLPEFGDYLQGRILSKFIVDYLRDWF